MLARIAIVLKFQKVGKWVKKFYRERVQDLTALTPGDWVNWSSETWYMSCSVYIVYSGPNEAFVGSTLCEM